MINKVIIYTDGACSGNPGYGGWGAYLIYENNKKRFQDPKKTQQIIEWN